MDMEEARIKNAGKPGKRPESVSEVKRPFGYYFRHTLLFILKVAALLVLFFSIQNITDIARSIPALNGLEAVPALAFSYFFIQFFAIYFFIVWFGSFGKFFRKLGATLVEIRGLLIYLVAVPLLFALVSGGLWWSVTRVKLASFLAVPFQWLPDYFQRLYAQGLPFQAYAGLTSVLLLALLFVIVFLQGLFDRSSGDETPADVKKSAKPVKEKVIYEKPVQPKGQPPLEMK